MVQAVGAAVVDRGRLCDPFAFLGDVPCHVHVIAGAESPVMPPDSARAFAAAIPGATLDIVDGAGHHVELDAPQLVAARILELATART